MFMCNRAHIIVEWNSYLVASDICHLAAVLCYLEHMNNSYEVVFKGTGGAEFNILISHFSTLSR